MLFYFSSTHLFLNLHSHSVELNFICYNIDCFDNYMNILLCLELELVSNFMLTESSHGYRTRLRSRVPNYTDDLGST